MRALKWIGSIFGAVIVLSAMIGLVIAIGSVAFIVGAIVLVCGVVMFIAALLRSLWEEVFS